MSTRLGSSRIANGKDEVSSLIVEAIARHTGRQSGDVSLGVCFRDQGIEFDNGAERPRRFVAGAWTLIVVDIVVAVPDGGCAREPFVRSGFIRCFVLPAQDRPGFRVRRS